jgi:hypothetical protein
MKKIFTLFLFFTAALVQAQNLDTLAFQDFEITPATPTWTFTGPVIYNANGFSNVNAAPPNSPIGIGGSRAWETTTNSGGLQLDFANVIIPAGYDSVRIRFNLAAMNLNGTSGGPDNLDFVLGAVSTDGGFTFYNRLRIRGATTDNCFWPYSATGVAKVYYQPQTEALFQPVTSGLQTTLGYSTCEIVFPGSVTQVQFRLTARSSSSSDTWLIDNVVITGENSCVNSNSSIAATSCGSYTAPSGAVFTTSGLYNDIIPNAAGCDSIIQINLVVNNTSSSSISPVVCGSYISPAGNTYTSSASFTDTLTNSSGCDSIISVNLTVNNASASSINPVVCGSYTSPSGNTYTNSASFTDIIPNAVGCDSVISVNLTVNNTSSSSLTPVACGSYTSPSGNIHTTSAFFMDTIPNAAGCDSIISINLVVHANPDTSISLNGATLTANATGVQYQWFDCNTNTPVSGAQSQTFLPSANGNYAVIVDNGNCIDTSSCVLVVSVGMNTVEAENVFSVMPNPVENVFLLKAAHPLQQAVFTLTDVQGRVIFTLGNQNGTAFTIDLAQLQSGMYVLQVMENAHISNIRIVKK